MKTVTELKQERATLLQEAEALLDAADQADRELTAEEQAKYDAAVERVESMNKDIERRMKLEAAAAPANALPAQPARPQPSAELNDDEIDPPGQPRATVRNTDRGPRVEIPRPYGRMVAFTNDAKGRQQAYRAGMWLLATLGGNLNAHDWCRKNGVGSRAALSGGVNTAGGALVPEEFSTSIIEILERHGLFRRVCRVVPMMSDTLNVPRRVGGLTAYYVGENVEGTESDGTWDNVALVAKKLLILTRMSSEISEDAVIDLADKMAEEMGIAFAEKEDRSGFLGDGNAASYGGIVGVFVKALDAAHTKAKVTAAGAGDSCDSLDEITGDHLLAMMGAVHPAAKRGASWFCSPTAEELVFNAIKIAGGGNTRDMLASSDTPRFLGYPIEVSSLLPDDPTADLSALAMLGFGNLRMAATLGSRREVRVALSSERYWSEDQIGVKGSMRHDINVHDMGTTSVKSPFVVLVGN
jgi:HK97 family phage major capsid protein